MQNYTFKRGWAPLIGALAGAYLTYEASADHPEWKLDPLWSILYGALGGLLCGCLIFLIDPPTAAGAGGDTTQPILRASVLARLTAIMGLVFFFLPPLGIALALVAVIANRKTKGWPRIVAWIGFVLSTLVVLFLLLMMFAMRAMPPPTH